MVDANTNRLTAETHVYPEVASIDTPPVGHVAVANKAGVMTAKNAAGTETELGGGSSALPVIDTTAVVMGSADNTKQIRFEVDGLTTATTRVLTPPDFDISLVGGAASASDNAIVRFDGTSGKLIQNSAASLDDSGNASFNGLTLTNPLGLQYLDDTGAGVSDEIVNNGANWVVRQNQIAPSPPGVNDDSSAGYLIGSRWLYSTTGDVYYCVDDAVGAAEWVVINNNYLADGIAFTHPLLQTWNNLNHGGGTYTEDTTNRRLVILEDGNGSAQFRGWYTAAPTAPYAIRVHAKESVLGASNLLAIGFRQNSTQELHILIIGNNTGTPIFAVQKWNTATSVNSNYIAATTIGTVPTWFKIEDNNTNRIISTSIDGVVWVVRHTIGRTDFLTADEIVVGMLVTTNAAYDSEVSILSYEEL